MPRGIRTYEDAMRARRNWFERLLIGWIRRVTGMRI